MSGHHHCAPSDNGRCVICKASPPPRYPLHRGRDEYECPVIGCGWTNHHLLSDQPDITGALS